MDSLIKREQPDRSKINLHEEYEVRYWTQALKVTEEQLTQAVKEVVGIDRFAFDRSAAAVRKELGLMAEGQAPAD